MADIQQDGRVRRQQDIFDLNRIKLINTAVDVINEVGDIREVTLTQIAKEAGVSPATAYNHFPRQNGRCIFSDCSLKNGCSRKHGCYTCRQLFKCRR